LGGSIRQQPGVRVIAIAGLTVAAKNLPARASRTVPADSAPPAADGASVGVVGVIKTGH